MEEKSKGVGKAASLLIRSGAEGVMLEETDGGPALIQGGKVYFPWSEVAWELKNDKITLVKGWDPGPIVKLLEKWERGTITTVAWEHLERVVAKKSAGPEPKVYRTPNSPIPGDPGKAPKAAGRVQEAVTDPRPRGKGKAGKGSGKSTEIPDPTPTVSRNPSTPLPPAWEEQDSYKAGVKERVDTTLYTNHIKCENCGADRWTKVQDAFQVTKCKPCAKRDRRKRRMANKKSRKAEEMKAKTLPPIARPKTLPKPKPTTRKAA
jgi:hypothetical protein